MALTDEHIAKLMMCAWGCASIAPRQAPTFARAIESAATAPLLERIAELERRNRDFYEDVQRFKEHALNERDARLLLEQQLSEARKDAQIIRNQALEDAAKCCLDIQRGWSSEQQIECANAIRAMQREI